MNVRAQAEADHAGVLTGHEFGGTSGRTLQLALAARIAIHAITVDGNKTQAHAASGNMLTSAKLRMSAEVVILLIVTFEDCTPSMFERRRGLSMEI